MEKTHTIGKESPREKENDTHEGIAVMLQEMGRVIVTKPIINSDLCHLCN